MESGVPNQADSHDEELEIQYENDLPLYENYNVDQQGGEFGFLGDFEAEHEADLSALRNQTSVHDGGSPVGGYQTPNASDMLVREMEDAFQNVNVPIDQEELAAAEEEFAAAEATATLLMAVDVQANELDEGL